jgi:hypothetical protein
MERANELDAKQIVEMRLDIELEHADKTGGVDYKTTEGQVAVEVTRVTDGRKEEGRKALRKPDQTRAFERDLLNCWLVFASDTQFGLKTFRQRVRPWLTELEGAGQGTFRYQRTRGLIRVQHPLAVVYRHLLLAGVERASVVPHRYDPLHHHRVIVSLGSGGSVMGSDDAVTLLSKTLGEKTDNPKKLAASGAEQRHLFVWLDDDTPFGIARPLSRPSSSSENNAFGLPVSAPELDPEITHLWVVHERSRRGWFWDGVSWGALEGL